MLDAVLLLVSLAAACAITLILQWHGQRQRLHFRLALADLMRLSPAGFEEYVAHVFARLGYKVINTPDNKDGGIDLLVRQRHSKTLSVIQCKRYDSRNTVGEATVRELRGVMADVQQRTTAPVAGVLVTTTTFTRGARRWAARNHITLIDGRRLVKMAR